MNNEKEKTDNLILEQIRDYTYKEVVIADTKAGLSLTISGASIAVYATTNNSLNNLSNSLSELGLFFSALGIFCSMLTILPRSYVTHEMAEDSTCWIYYADSIKNSFKRRLYDAFFVLKENLWQKQREGTANSIDTLFSNKNTLENVNSSLHNAMQRAIIAQELKFLWVGKSLIFSFCSVSFIGMSILFSPPSSSSNAKSQFLNKNENSYSLINYSCP